MHFRVDNSIVIMTFSCHFSASLVIPISPPHTFIMSLVIKIVILDSIIRILMPVRLGQNLLILRPSLLVEVAVIFL